MDVTRLLSFLRTCTHSKSLNQGKLIHQKILSSGFQTNIALCKSLIDFYFSCHDYDSAKLVFSTIDNPLDISLWNGLIATYTKNFMYIEALELFERLLRYPYLRPDSYTFPSILKACGGLGRVGLGKMIHTHLVKTGIDSDVFITSSLVSAYAKCDEFECAIKVFYELPQRDVGCWNSVIACYFHDGQAEKALEMFEKMKGSGFEPNSVTLSAVISSCTKLLDLERGKEIHRELTEKGILLDDFVGSALVDMYGKCGVVELAKEVFKQIPRKNVISWNAMIAGYSLNGDSQSCFELFMRMNEEGMTPTLTTLSCILLACSRSPQLRNGKFIHGYVIRNGIKPDIYINSSLISLYCKCGCILSAETVFKTMSKTDVVSWNVMISGYVIVGGYFEALRIYDNMREVCVMPDAITFTSVLTACSQLAALEKGREIHSSLKSFKLENNEKVAAALLTMYAKCGAVDEAQSVFYQLSERDSVSWTSMITAYGSHGQALEALKLFREMQQSSAKPDEVTYLAVLSACSHAGLVDEGCYYFNQMIVQYDIEPQIEHYSCLIDLLGRAGRFDEAYEMLQKSPETRGDIGLLSTLFSACRLHKNLALGIVIAEKLIEADPDDSSTYVILSNMYASLEKWDELREVRLKMKELGLRKSPGCSWIEINKRIQPFFVEDKSNPHADLLYECLGILANHMEKDELLLCSKQCL